MKILLILCCSLFIICNTVTASAVTIRNKCNHPIAGSITIAESNIKVAQFRIIPGEKIHLLKNFGKMELILRAIPDIYNLEKLDISSADLNTPHCYIELKCSANGIKIKVD